LSILNEPSPIYHEADKHFFAEKVNNCLSDPSVAGYFKRGIVESEGVVDALVDGPSFDEAVFKHSYRQYADEQEISAKLISVNAGIIASGALNPSAIAAFTYIAILIALFAIEVLSADNFIKIGHITLATLLVASSAALFSAIRISPTYRLRKGACLIATASTLACIIVLPQIYNFLPQLSYSSSLLLALTLIAGYLLPRNHLYQQCRQIHIFIMNKLSLLLAQRNALRLRTAWLDDCVEDIIMPQVVLTINTVLGVDKDRFLVEQDSEGLRKLQDPKFTVPTGTERKIKNAFTQMDGGSVALSGPRGAGKSTILRKFSGPFRTEMKEDRSISVYLSAPAEYDPRDFIAELLQKLCEAYLKGVGLPLPETSYAEQSKFGVARLARYLMSSLWIIMRTVILIALIVWLIRPYIDTHYHHDYNLGFATLRDWYHHASEYSYKQLKEFRPAWIVMALRIMVIGFAALLLLVTPSVWRRRTRRYAREPALFERAREYLDRLQLDKTITWGTSLTPAIRGAGMSISRGGTISYTPWTLPELVGHTRQFMEDVAEWLGSDHAIVVGIDEIDRIDSLSHAEKFIGGIKAVFGVERCYFLVAVAEDVGSIFAQRATAGRFALDNAFDDIVVASPLNFHETRVLLLRRVLGFTDSFAYLVHAISGGLPREVIRVTRRLVDLNQELGDHAHHLRLEDLACALVRDELIESIRETRTKLSLLSLHADWASIFEELRSAGTRLRRVSLPSMPEFHASAQKMSRLKEDAVMHESYEIVQELSELKGHARAIGDEDGERARAIVTDFSAFAYFGLTIMDAFSERYFNLLSVEMKTGTGSEGSYEELAFARIELTVSPMNSRAMLARFRECMIEN
jgi:hypothetical protein